MNTYATIDELAEVGEKSLKLGRLVAVSQFTRALIRHGSFQEYRIYCPNPSSIDRTKERLEGLLEEKELDRVALTLVPNLHAEMASQPFDVMHAASGWTVLSSLAHVRNAFAAEPFPLTALIHSLNDSFAHLRLLKIALSAHRPYDAIVCSSDAGRKTMESFLKSLAEKLGGKEKPRYRGKFVKIPLAIHVEDFSNQDQAACRKELDLPADATILLYLGRLSVHDKWDPGPVFHLFRRLLKERPEANLRFVLAGGGLDANVRYFQETCKEMGIAKEVLFRPNFEDHQKAKYYAAADVFVSMVDNLQETFGISVVEAMASGLPCVVSDFDGYRELVENGKSGFSIPTYWGPAEGILNPVSTLLDAKFFQLFLAQSVVIDMGRFREVLLQLIDQPELRRKIGAGARQRAESLYSWKNVIRSYETLWTELKAEASKDTTLPDSSKDPFAVDYFRSFKHFATREVQTGWQVSLTEFGREAIQGKDFPALYRDLGPLVSEEWLKLLFLPLLKQPATIGQLVEFLNKEAGAASENALFHILWLAKHDVLALQP